MDKRVDPQLSLVGQWLAGLLMVALLAVDAVPVLHGAPMVLIGLMGVVQMGREIGAALARRSVHPSTPMMNFWGSIVFLHTLYFARSAQWSTAIEVINTVLIALFLLVLAAAVTTEAKFHGWVQGVRDLSLALGLPGFFGLAVGAGAAIQAGHEHRATAAGSALIAVVVAAAWLANGAAAVADRMGVGEAERPARLPATMLGLVARVVTMAVAMGIGCVATKSLAPATALAAGAAGGVGGWLGHRLVDWAARWCEVDRFHGRLPSHVATVQGLYDRVFDGGLLDYAGSLLLALPAVLAVLLLMGG
ncbi:MAG: hypothetical protein HZB16_12830 [Armatimonadetes bacterium]|nr:hypothetical protein [Armatimonadota bacterium]